MLGTGIIAPDFELYATPDQRVRLSELNGKRIILAFEEFDMKKLVSLINILLVALSVQAQVQVVQFIDSLDTQIDPQKTVLLFTEFRDTIDSQTGQTYTQRNSYYFDWVHRELRYIEAYDFDGRVRKHKTERAFNRKKNIPSSTHIKYTFFDNKLVKVGITPSARQCNQCAAAYYFANDILILKVQQSVLEPKRNFMSDVTLYLGRLQIKKKSENFLSNKQ